MLYCSPLGEKFGVRFVDSSSKLSHSDTSGTTEASSSHTGGPNAEVESIFLMLFSYGLRIIIVG